MKFSELHPMGHGKIDGRMDLQFDCPKCGPPWRVSICCSAEGGQPATWKFEPWGTADGWDAVTITPSINNHHHGRKKECGAHMSITKGEVTP